jgi:uncharacterized glyoxalase superfamily protein PhnB
MNVAMDHGWILTFASVATAMVQVSCASEAGSGTLVPDLSIEVDDLDEVYSRIVAAGVSVEYGPATEPWACAASMFEIRSAVC